MSFLAAAPAMGIVGSTGAIGPTLLSSAIAPTAITAASTAAIVPSVLTTATPSFFGGITSAFQNIYSAVQPYTPMLSAAGQVFQGLNALQAGQTQASMYRLQQIQLESKLINDRLNMTRQSNDVLRRLNAANASAVARGYAGGVKGYEGSSAMLMALNDKYAGQDLEVIQENIKTSGTYGQIQDSMLTTAADKAVSGSYSEAFASVGKAFYLYSTLKTA
jgi:hypothetical protein